MADKRILFIHPGMSTFVRQDFDLISEKFEVREFNYHSSKSLVTNLREQTRLLLWLSYRIWWCDSIFIWFADYHSALPVLFSKMMRKHSFIVIGGYDAVHIPELNYGAFKNPIRSFLTKFSIKNTSLNLPVANRLGEKIEQRISHANILVLPTGYDSDYYRPFGEKVQHLVITVAIIDTIQRFQLKGIDLLIEVAKKMANISFMIIGINDDIKATIAHCPSNIRLIGKLKHNEIVKYYQKAKVYSQLSLSEGLPNTLCEAMLCGCIPIGTDVGDIKYAIGDTGFIVKERTVEGVIVMLKKALQTDINNGLKARQRISTLFPEYKRKKKIYKLLSNAKQLKNE